MLRVFLVGSFRFEPFRDLYEGGNEWKMIQGFNVADLRVRLAGGRPARYVNASSSC